MGIALLNVQEIYLPAIASFLYTRINHSAPAPILFMGL